MACRKVTWGLAVPVFDLHNHLFGNWNAIRSLAMKKRNLSWKSHHFQILFMLDKQLALSQHISIFWISASWCLFEVSQCISVWSLSLSLSFHFLNLHSNLYPYCLSRSKVCLGHGLNHNWIDLVSFDKTYPVATFVEEFRKCCCLKYFKCLPSFELQKTLQYLRHCFLLLNLM